MGTNARAFAPLPPVTLEDLVPPDHFCRHLERTLNLAFVRDLVNETDAQAGRPGIDPVVFFTLQLVLFFEGLRSERQPSRVAADRPSVRWWPGPDPAGPLPDHSSPTRIRGRCVLAVCRRVFAAIDEQSVRRASCRPRGPGARGLAASRVLTPKRIGYARAHP